MALIIPSRATGKLFGPVGPSVNFGWITDSHYDPLKATDPSQGGKVYQDTYNKLTDIFAIFNARSDLSFVIQNGDFIDGSANATAAQTDLATITNLFQTCKQPQYHVLGNHEETQLNKAQVMAITGQPAKWYSFVAGGITFIVLDGNFSADNDTADLSVTSVSGASPYVSYIPPTQRVWLEATIAASPYPCVVICHYPVYYVGAFSWGLTNAAAVRTILEAYADKVIACIGGHLHDNFTRIVNGITYASTHAVVTAPYPSLNYAIISIYPQSRTLKLLCNGKDMSSIPASGRTPSNPVNLLTHTQAFDLWTPQSMTVTADVANDPFGNLVADRAAESAQLLGHSLTSNTFNVTAGFTYTLSVYAKYETAQFMQLLLGGAAFGFNAFGNFDLQNGVPATMGSSASGKVVDVGSGWRRYAMTVLCTTTTTTTAVIFGANSGAMGRAQSYTGSPANTRLLADVQMEIGAVANKYMPVA